MALPQRWLQQGQTMLPARVSEDGHRVALAPTRTPHVRGKIPPLTKSAVKASIVMAGVAFAGLCHPAEVALVAAIGDLSVNSHPMKKDSTGCASSLRRSPQYPLKSSTNHRYLVDQNNVPFLMVGDAPQTLVANLSVAETEKYLSNRRGYGINTLWINLLCNFSDGCNKKAETFDGVAPFTVFGDLASPNPAYFQRADEIIKLAAKYGMLVLLDPIETSSWLDTLRTNGPAKAFAYGRWLGNRYKDYQNIIWMHGNDFQSWNSAPDDALVQAVARGIRSADPNHIHTIELNYHTSGSLDDPAWAPLIELDAAYTYFPTYAQVLKEYNRPKFKPVFLIEGNYELEHLSAVDGGSTQNLRKQEYWTMLSGATGQVYGNYYTWRLSKGWESNIDTAGVNHLCHMAELFLPRRWYDLLPDQSHNVLVGGYGEFSETVGKLSVRLEQYPSFVTQISARVRKSFGWGSIETNAYAAAAGTSDGSLVMAYIPSARTVTIDMSRLAGPTMVRWYDPTSGSYAEVVGSPFTNVGKKEFTTPGRNNDGDSDWVLLLDASDST
jgi:hypothetical protein